MTTPTAAPPTRLADYRPPAFLVHTVELTFHLNDQATRVISKIDFQRNPAGSGPFRLDGENLRLIWARIDGTAPSGMKVDETGLSLDANDLPERFTWEAEVEINPAANTALEGLYTSRGMFCTQCEAEGFRKITYYPDRPDVMATFHVRIEGDQPVMLSNGNPVASGPGWAEWHDPWPKPSYLFALVAGQLVSFDDSFITMSGREVALKIWVRPPDREKCAYAMDSLKRAMRWDEETYGREYDLDLFQIVAVDDFNMGAMENKGLNIFNSKYILASPETATDTDYELIEGIIAHEYFHNWTGDRITCRDWFQLSLKEGLTVFRDQSFSGDQRSRPVKRINSVQQLRARQFREDSGPLAHPVQPQEYKEINNFYTATIYEKGAEVIGMLKTLVGDKAYRRALDLYFRRHDGQACTIDDWLAVFAETTGRDLTQFRLWYSQSGTPRISVSDDYRDGTYTLTFRQSNPPTPGQKNKRPQLIPIATGLLSANGDEVVKTQVLELTAAEQSFVFEGLASRPIPSILRNFSAPVILDSGIDAKTQAFLLAHDTDPFNKWEAGQTLARDTLIAMATRGDPAQPTYLDALHRVALDDSLAPAFRALALALPSETAIAQKIAAEGATPDPLAIYHARNSLKQALATELGADLPRLLEQMRVTGPYSPAAEDAGKRAFGAALLGLLSQIDNARAAAERFAAADNMTESLGALSCLIRAGQADDQLDRFFARWQDNALVIDKWFALQANLTPPEAAIETMRRLAARKDFDWKNPNRARALLGGFAMMNPAGFHAAGGEGYAFVTDWLIRLDPINPQTTARLCAAFDSWRWFDQTRRSQIETQLKRLQAQPGLSRDTAEMIERILAG